MVEQATDPTLFRLEDQVRWYEEKSAFSKRWYVRLRIASMISAATIPIKSSLSYPRVTGVLGALIVVIEGIRQLNSFHENWIRYRATSESLKHEKYLYLGGAGPYRSATDPKQPFRGTAMRDGQLGRPCVRVEHATVPVPRSANCTYPCDRIPTRRSVTASRRSRTKKSNTDSQRNDPTSRYRNMSTRADRAQVAASMLTATC